MYQTKLLRDEHVEPLAEGVYEVLERVGLLCQNQELLQALAKLGAKVDYQTERAWFPKKMVREFVDGLRKEYSGRPLPDPAFSAPGLPGFGCQVAQIYYDHRNNERRGGNSRDFIEMIKLADVLHPNSPAGHCLVPTEFPGRIEALESAMLMAEYAHRPDAAFAWFVEQVDYLKEMGEILGIPNWFHWGALCFAHPLRFDKDVADKFVRRAKEGVSAGLTAMPIAGTRSSTALPTTSGLGGTTAGPTATATATARRVTPRKFREQAMAAQAKLAPDPVGDFFQGGTFCSAEFDDARAACGSEAARSYARSTPHPAHAYAGHAPQLLRGPRLGGSAGAGRGRPARRG